jgi:hypothetical protein
MIDDKQRPIDGGDGHLASKPTISRIFSATQPHKGKRIIETYGAGDGNRTHVRRSEKQKSGLCFEKRCRAVWRTC